ncbi:MAG: hypothetical protein C0490_21750, partial [Marivirga sp.]|nr:hypothetical protein [Marivirga sp.]
MERIKTYFFILFLFSASALLAQKKPDTSVPSNFPDSVRVILEKTRNTDAAMVGNSFASAWGSLGADQQIVIQRQVGLMKRKKIPVRPHLVNYFGAIANAVTLERADPSKISSFLKVAALVVENEASAKAANFLAVSRTFFQYHALHYEKSFRLYARDDDYTFDYIAPAPAIDLNAPIEPTADEQSETETSSSGTDAYTDQTYDSTYIEAPLWSSPPPQPFADGPVIRFSRVTLNFVTKYDSVFLKNTKGILSFRTNLFIGEEGSFDWSPAGLSPDSVTCNVVAYNFNVKKPEFKSDLVKLNYVGKTPGFIPGTFEFKSTSRPDSVPSTYPRFRSFQNSLAIQGIGDANVKYSGGFSLIGRKITSASVTGAPSTIEVYHNGEKKFTARSSSFEFTDSTIVAQKSSINIPVESDSITHPVVRMK